VKDCHRNLALVFIIVERHRATSGENLREERSSSPTVAADSNASPTTSAFPVAPGLAAVPWSVLFAEGEPSEIRPINRSQADAD
jgi:hypothetical protein